MMHPEYEYQPGVCNINYAEINYRRKAGYYLTAGGVIGLTALTFAQLNPLFGIILFLPFWVGALGFLQAKNKFCVSYGASGKHNASNKYGETAVATDQNDLAKDKQKTKQINLRGALIGVVATVLSVVVLYLL